MRDGGVRCGLSNWEWLEADFVGLCLRSIACRQGLDRVGLLNAR